MPAVSFVVPPPYQNNRLFGFDPLLNRDDALAPFRLLQQAFQQRGYSLNTHDITPPAQAERVIYFDLPAQLPSPAQRATSYCILTETAVVKPENWQLAKHAHFAKLFTYCTEYVDDQRYFLLFLARGFAPLTVNLAAKNRFCCLIAGNKKSSHPNELYSERIRAIRWFENHAPTDFDLYGIGWDKATFSGLLRPLNRVPLARKLMAPRFPSYRGPIAAKNEVLARYKFTIAYENGRDIPGYVTGDKIFDALQAGCVPVYWGAPDITKYVPAECFIDRRNFTSYPQLYAHLRAMPAKTYQEYMENIAYYINQVAPHGPFTHTAYVETLVREVLPPR
jgi:hypothetical protein